METTLVQQGVRGAVTFSCPACGKMIIERTAQARAVAAKYTCASCGFIGPN